MKTFAGNHNGCISIINMLLFDVGCFLCWLVFGWICLYLCCCECVDDLHNYDILCFWIGNYDWCMCCLMYCLWSELISNLNMVMAYIIYMIIHTLGVEFWSFIILVLLWLWNLHDWDINILRNIGHFDIQIISDHYISKSTS